MSGGGKNRSGATALRPWRTLKSWTVSQDAWHCLRAETCETASGGQITPYYMHECPDFVCVLALNAAGEVVLVREYRHGAAKIVEGLPSGVVDPGEAPAVAAARELGEETGYSARDYVSLGSVYANWANHTNQVHCFLALGCALTGEQDLDEHEEIEVVLRPLTKVRAPGFLQQAFHIACLHYGLAVLEENRLQAEEGNLAV